MTQNNILGLVLRSYRKDNSLTQAKLAELLDVTDKTISKWELGYMYPSKRNLMKISNVINVNLDALLKAENP